MMRFFLAALVLLLSACSSAPPPQSPLGGTWVGWAYLGEDGDLPVRFDISDANGHLTAAFDSPAHPLIDHPAEEVSWQAPVLRLRLRTAKGTVIALEGERRGESIAGTIAWGESKGTFEIVRSPVLLGNVDATAAEGATGFFRNGRGGLIEIRKRGWGEMFLLDRISGDLRTLMPVAGDNDRFLIGSANYLPSPHDGYVRLNRTGDSVTSIEFEDRREGRYQRVSLREEEVTFRNGDAVLSGTLLLPPGKGPHPALAILGGSSWETRADLDFRSRALAALGFAMLVWDNRGSGESTGSMDVPFEAHARDAIAAIELLENRPDIDDARTGILGVSRGGWQAPLAATLSDRVDFLVLLVPPAVSPADQETRSRLDQMRAQNFPPEKIALAERLLNATWRWVRSGEWDEYAALRHDAVAQELPDYVLESEERESADWDWARLNMFHDPCPVLGNVRVPVLAVFGSNDLYVHEPTNRARMRECLPESADLTMRTIEGAGHNLAVRPDVPFHRYPGQGSEGVAEVAAWREARFGS